MGARENGRSADQARFVVRGERRTSSRESAAGAGWGCSATSAAWRGRWDSALAEVGLTADNARLSWKSLHTLLAARHEKLVLPPLKRWPWGDFTHGQRQAWIDARPPEELLIDRTKLGGDAAEKVVFMLLGDTGEGDASQYAVVEPLLRESTEAEFTIIASDVVYPAGSANEYILKFYAAYSELSGPIYAVPGNHDWDDGELSGFMYHVCGIDDVPAKVKDAGNPVLRRLRLWTKPPPAHTEASTARRAGWWPKREPRQTTPYWALDAGPLRIVGIDTGVGGPIDERQGEWLDEVSDGGRPKILVTGKPLYVDGEHHPGEIAGSDETIDDLVRAPEHHYIAAIGGDIHNYQRYPAVLEPGEPDGIPRLVQYIVSGGGGAFTNGTHTIERVEIAQVGGLPAIVEEDFRCYPRRGDSLSYYCGVYKTAFKRLGRSDRLLAKLMGLALDEGARRLLTQGGLDLDPALASEVMARHTRIANVRADPTTFTEEQLALGERVRKIVSPLPKGRLAGMYFPFWDRDEPPFFKSFLRVEADLTGVIIRCFAATGCGEHEASPPLEDVARWDAARGWSTRFAGLGGADDTVRGRAEAYRRGDGTYELVVSGAVGATLPEPATVRISPSPDLAQAHDVGTLTIGVDGGLTPLALAADERFGGVEIVDGSCARFASGRFW